MPLMLQGWYAGDDTYNTDAPHAVTLRWIYCPEAEK